jgi:hypothetical protein
VFGGRRVEGLRLANSRDREVVKGAFDYEGREKEEAITRKLEVSKSQNFQRQKNHQGFNCWIFMDRDPEVPKSQKLQSQTELGKLNGIETIFFVHVGL